MGLISQQSIESVINANDIVEVVSSYVRLEKRSSLNLFGLCPFHEEKTPSFSVSPGKQIFYCFGCQKGGNVIKFIQEIEHVSYPEAIRRLADKAGITIEESGDDSWKEKYERDNLVYEALLEAARFFYSRLEDAEGTEARNYLEQRGISKSLYRKYGLGYAPKQGQAMYDWLAKKGIADQVMLEGGLILKSRGEGYYDFFRHRVMFPIMDTAGRVLAFGGRSIRDDGPKYINSPETVVYTKGKHLFGLPQAVKSARKEWFLVEGYFDVIALAKVGMDNVVAPLGTALTDYQARAIGRHADTVNLLMDNDRAGRDASLRARTILENKGIATRFILLKGAKDPDEYFSSFGCERLTAALSETLDATEYQLALLKLDVDSVLGMPSADYRNGALDLLAAEPDIVKRELYSGRLAKELQINRRAIREEVERRHNVMKAGPRGAVSQQRDLRRGNVRRDNRRKLRKYNEDEIFILMMLADNTQLIHIKPSVPKAKLGGYALSDDTGAFLSSEQATAPLSASDFGNGFLREVAALSIIEAAKGSLTLAALHANIDNIWETNENKLSDDERDDSAPDVPELVHSMVQQQFNAYDASELSKQSLGRVYLQRLIHLRLSQWERQATIINRKAGELEMAGSDKEAAEHYANAVTLTTAAQVFRMITQGEQQT